MFGRPGGKGSKAGLLRRPKRRFMDIVKEEMKLVGVREEDSEDRV